MARKPGAKRPRSSRLVPKASTQLRDLARVVIPLLLTPAGRRKLRTMRLVLRVPDQD